MSGKFIVPIQLPLLFTKPDNNPAEGYYKLYLRDDKLRKMDWLGIEEEIGGTDITTTQISQWTEAYNWGNHATAGYVTLGTNQEITGVKTFTTRQYFNDGFTVNNGNVKFYKTGRTEALVDIDHDNGRVLYRYNDILSSSATPSLIAHLFTSDQGFVRVDHYGSFQGTYDVGHQYNFWYGNTTSTAGLWNINFIGTTISNRPLMTINNGSGAGLFNTPAFKLMSNGNLLLGIGTDAGQKLQVNGAIRGTSFVVTNGTASQFLKANGTVDSNVYLTSITSANVTTALGYTPVTNARTLTINGVAYDLTANRSWTISTATPTLDAVTTAGNTTTNAITVGGLVVDTNTLVVDSVNNRVGIGTTNPAYNLQIIDTTSGTPQQLDIKNTTAAARAVFTLTNDSSNSFFMQIGGSSYVATTLRNVAAIASQGATVNSFWIATNWETSSGGSTPIKFVTGGYNNSPTMTITAGNTGNVLINTTTDSGYKLDVNGTVRVQGTTNFGVLGNTGYQTHYYNLGNTYGGQGYIHLTGNGANALFFTMGDNTSLTGNQFQIVRWYDNEYGNNIVTMSASDGRPISIRNGSNLASESLRIASSQVLVKRQQINSGSITAATALARGVYFNNTLVAAANNDVLVGLDIAPTFTPGAFTGVSSVALRTTSGEVRFGSLTATTTPKVVYYDTTTGRLSQGDAPVTSYARRSDFVVDTDYMGVAVAGSSESASVWKIYKIVVSSSGATTKTSATNVAWTDRYTVTYS